MAQRCGIRRIGRVGNSPITYELDGRQYVLVGEWRNALCVGASRPACRHGARQEIALTSKLCWLKGQKRVCLPKTQPLRTILQGTLRAVIGTPPNSRRLLAALLVKCVHNGSVQVATRHLNSSR